MQGELVFTTTEDFVRLHGFYSAASVPPATSSSVGSVDAAVILHGLGGNFYSSRLLIHFAETLRKLGISIVIVNTRGHDMINTSTWSGRSQSVGSALENVGHAKFDVSAWVDFMVKRGHHNVLVFGHSLGAIKSLYSQAYQPHPSVKSIICLSATRLSYRQLIASPRGQLFRETIARCESLIAEGRPDDPIHVPFPFPTWMTPQCYLDKYGPEETYNWLRFVERVSVPTLLLFGQKELDLDPAFDGVRAELEALRLKWLPLTIEIVDEADHFYTSRFEAVEDLLRRWLTSSG